MNMNEIYGLAKNALKLAEKESTDLTAAEVFVGKSKYLNAEIEENSIKNSQIGFEAGISIRTIDNRGSLGFSFTNILDEKSIERIVITALKMMRAGTPDPEFKDLPQKSSQYPEVKNLYDQNLAEMEIEQSASFVKELIKICEKDDLAISQSGGFKSNFKEILVMNTNGIEASEKTTTCSISSSMVVKDKVTGDVSTGFDWQSERSLERIDAHKIGQNALKNGKQFLNRKKINNMNVPVILTPKGTINMILKPLASAINAEAFQYNRSFLVGKRGENIGSDLFTIKDNALMDGKYGSSNFDGEGVPCKNKTIIEEGKFLDHGLLHNSYTASKENIESTGNAARSSYSSLPSIGTSNFIMESGNREKDSIIHEVKEGILLDYTGDRPNVSNGDFSGLILHGNLIKDGEIKDPLNETMFAINLKDLFENIDAVSKEFKVYGSFFAPYVRIKNVQIIGAK
jgi:PmbA protein